MTASGCSAWRITRATVLGGVLALWASPCLAVPQAGEEVDALPPWYRKGSVEDLVGELEREGSPFYRGRFEDRYADELGRGGFVAAARDMVGRLRRQDWGDQEPTQRILTDWMEDFLVAMEDALVVSRIADRDSTMEQGDRFLRQLGDGGWFLGALKPVENERGALAWFPDQDPDDEVGVAVAERLDGDRWRLLLDEPQVRDLRLLTDALDHLVFQLIEPLLDANVESLQQAVTRWENYLDRGYSQYPWESLFNGWVLDLPELGPPDRQWILLHPALGVEMSVDPLDEARIKEALNLETVGHLWYRGDDLDDYFGLSLTVTLREDLDPGVGVLFHLRRHWNVGVAWHDVDEDPFVFFSVDLFRFASRRRDAFQERYEGLRDRLGGR